MHRMLKITVPLFAGLALVALFLGCGAGGGTIETVESFDIRQVISYLHRVDLRADQTLEGSGSNNYGQLGTDDTRERLRPVPVFNNGSTAGLTFKQVSTGAYHTLALTTDGRVYSAGYNGFGQLGSNAGVNETPHSSPKRVNLPEGVTVAEISAGSYHSIALTDDGKVYAWGYNGFGQVGTEPERDANGRIVPVPVPQEVDFSAVAPPLTGQIIHISAGAHHNLALTDDGKIYAWGDDTFFQLGIDLGEADPPDYPHSSVPVDTGVSSVRTGTNPTNSFYTFYAGGYHNLAVHEDGRVWSWGFNGRGQLGIGNITTVTVPQFVLGLSDVAAVSAGGNHSLAMKGTELWGWGLNTSGQVGDAHTTNREAPVKVETLEGEHPVTGVRGTGNYSVAFTNMTGLWTWGDNRYGQLGDGKRGNRNKPFHVRER